MVPRRWTLGPYLRLLRTEYDAPNPFVDPAIKRRDDEWRAGVMFDMPVTAHFGVSTTIQYARTSSTLPNYRNENLSVVFGPTARF
jgi:hypothetical protein